MANKVTRYTDTDLSKFHQIDFDHNSNKVTLSLESYSVEQTVDRDDLIPIIKDLLFVLSDNMSLRHSTETLFHAFEAKIVEIAEQLDDDDEIITEEEAQEVLNILKERGLITEIPVKPEQTKPGYRTRLTKEEKENGKKDK